MSIPNFITLLHQPYSRANTLKGILKSVFQTELTVFAQAETIPHDHTLANRLQIQTVQRYALLTLDDGSIINCYEVLLQPQVLLERNRIGIQQFVRQLMTAGDSALISFVQNEKPVWRLTFVQKTAGFDAQTFDVVSYSTNAKRYTYIINPAETNRTLAERLQQLAQKPFKTIDDIVQTFSVEALSNDFFNEYKAHYQAFADYLLATPSYYTTFFKNDDKAVRDFSKKLLGRIIFLYFVQKKEWLACPTDTTVWQGGDAQFMTTLFERTEHKALFYTEQLQRLFFEALNTPRPNDTFALRYGNETIQVRMPFLNGGLFEKEQYDQYLINFPPDFFKTNGTAANTPKTLKNKDARGFLDFLNAYNFTIQEDAPNDHTVAVDPEMLGNIFENLLEDNKDKGAYYTPKAIVHYMCQESLTTYLATALLPDDAPDTMEYTDLKAFIQTKILNEFAETNRSTLQTLLQNVKICDPAIGSGAFPMGLLQEIYQLQIALHAPDTTPNYAALKQHIIQNSIYGVDIERGAVDIARLRFWLSLIVDETKPQPLPNLDYKIMQGNSLVSVFEHKILAIDWDIKWAAGTASENIKNMKKTLKEVVVLQTEYLTATDKKQVLATKIRANKIKILQHQLTFNRDKYKENNPIQGGFAPTAQHIVFNLKRKEILDTFNDNLKKLERLVQHPEQPLLFFDWKLDFPEVMHPALFEDNTDINALNAQIIALNTQIDAINLQLDVYPTNEHLLHLQTNIAQSQTTLLKAQITKIASIINIIYGKILPIHNNIVNEPDLTILYQIKSINHNIDILNKDIIQLNKGINTKNANIGFDIVIGNPPYIKVQNIDKTLNNYFKANYKASTGKYDIYVIFVENALNLIKENGAISFINPHRFLIAEYGKGLRDILFEHKALKKLLYFGINQIFETATTYTGIFFIQKNATHFSYAMPTSKDFDDLVFLQKAYTSSNFNFSVEDNEDTVLAKIQQHKSIKNIFSGVYQGLISMGDDIHILEGIIQNDVFVGYSKALGQAVSIEANIMKPLLKGEHIQRYTSPKTTIYIFYPHYQAYQHHKLKTLPYEEDVLKANYPKAYAYISHFKTALQSKKEKYKTNPKHWYALHRSRHQFMFEQNKIITPQLQNQPSFTYDDCGFYADAGGYMLLENNKDLIDLKSYLAVLNSKLFYYFITKTSTPYNNNYFYFKTNYIEPFCIPLTLDRVNDHFIILVNDIIAAKADGKDTQQQEQTIDTMVYKLYQLTYSEVLMIDIDFPLSAVEYADIIV